MREGGGLKSDKKCVTYVFIISVICFFSGFKKFPRKEEEEEVLHGTDWESVNYNLEKLACSEDEITGITILYIT